MFGLRGGPADPAPTGQSTGLRLSPVRATSIHRLLSQPYWWLWSFVGLVSLYDALLVVLFREVISSTEENPVGIALLRLDSGGLTYFLPAKLMGTAIVLGALVGVYRLLQNSRHLIIGGVASFQAWLLWYLNFSM